MCMRFLVSLSILTLASASFADVTTPHGGMTLVRHPSSAMVIANLCAPGVSMRATKFSERQATPQAWAQNVGAQAAINADFFDFPGWSWVLVRARGAGEDWPAAAQKLEQPSGYWQFGPGVSGIQPNSLVPPAGNVTDIVGAYDPLIAGGQPVDQSGNPFMLQSYRRSAIGLSADRATVYLYASNGAINGPGMIQDLVAMAAEAGAPPIAEATNQDGGGSSQLYVQGLGQVITSGRQVNDHLGIYAAGAGPSPNCPNHPPAGYLDGVACDGITGWAQDPDQPTKTIDVHLYFDGPAGAAGANAVAVHADRDRADLCKPLGTCNHGFNLDPPRSLLDGKPHDVHAYGIDSSGGNNPELAQSPRTLTCTAPAVKGLKRWVSNETIFGNWHFSWFVDVMPVDDGPLNAMAADANLPDAPVLIHADDGSPEIWLVDQGQKRWVPDPAAAAAWHFDLGAAKLTPASTVKAMPTGQPLVPRPRLVKGSGPAVYLVEDAPPALPTADGGTAPATPDEAQAGTEGCDCRAAPAAGSSWWVLVVAALALHRRRR